MKRQRLISQGVLSRIFQSASEAWKRQEHQGSIDILERGSRLDPAFIAPWLERLAPFIDSFGYPR